MRGVLLAGGTGTRLRPLTHIANKHLLPVYNKPMILYPLEILKGLGVNEILVVAGGEHVGAFADFLGDGSTFGVRFTYKVQKQAGGIAQALSLADDFVTDQFVVILGDNIFEYPPALPLKENCGFVLKEVENPERFGVFHDGEIIEKPKKPLSNKVVTGIYFYTPEIFDFISTLEPSARGELEITDVNNWCLKNRPTTTILYDGFWSDAGTFDSLMRASTWAFQKHKRIQEGNRNV